MSGKTTIAISIETKERLDKVGNKGDTYDDIIVQLLNRRQPSKKDRASKPRFFGRLLGKRIWRDGDSTTHS